MTKKQKRMILRISCSFGLFVLGLLLPMEEYVEIAVFLAAYLIIGWDVLFMAVRNIFRGEIFDENFLMTIAGIGAFCIGEYPEGAAVMLFYQVGELFQSYAVGKSRKSIADLMNIRPEYANLLRDGKWVKVNPEEVSVGDQILVSAGEKIPLDGRIVSGTASMDSSALTGESAPRSLEEGDEALSGCINLSGVLTIQVTKSFGESMVTKILNLVEYATEKKAKSEQFITKFARVYTPIVVAIAALLAVLPPLLISGETFTTWIYRALTFLVISCPCALVISVPLSFFAGIGAASRKGILVKGSNYLEALGKTEMVVFDKTGTLTEGRFAVSKICPVEMKEAELLEWAALAENFSGHPISVSLKNMYEKEIDFKRIGQFEEISGHGIKAVVDGKTVLAGNEKLMKKEGIENAFVSEIGTIVHIAVSGKYEGYIVISDTIKPDAREIVQYLKKSGIRIAMLTGDTKEVGQRVSDELKIDEVYTQLLPSDKLEKVEGFLTKKKKRGTLSFVGDGINDAPVLARADIGIAMGGLGSDAAIEAADIVLMDDRPSKIKDAIAIAKKTVKIANQNIVFALGIKILILLLGAVGIASMWAAVFADVGVSVLAILNAMRAFRD